MKKFIMVKLTEKVAVPLLFQIAQYFSFLKQYRVKSIKLLNNQRELALLTNDDRLLLSTISKTTDGYGIKNMKKILLKESLLSVMKIITILPEP